MTPQTNDIDKVFKALGHVTRRRILQLLAERPRYPYELGKLLNLHRRAVLKHLDALREAGLVEREPGESSLGPDRVYYRLSVSFELSATILPDVFVVRLTHADSAPRVTRVPTADTGRLSGASAVRRLLEELRRVDTRLREIEDEAMRLTALRSRLVREIEAVARACGRSPEECRRLRSLLEPFPSLVDDALSRHLADWTQFVREMLAMFRRAQDEGVGDGTD